MQVKPEDIERHLSDGLAPCYLVSGDEALLVEEACDAILQGARAAGFTERSIHHGDAGFKWDDLNHDSASLSLFAERKVIDLRLPAKKLDKAGGAAIVEWLENHAHAGDTLLLIRTGRLEPRQRSSAWFKAVDKTGVISLAWPVDARQLSGWLAARLRAAGMSCDRDALQYLADRVEGNLLAAAQEIQKLKLQDLPSPIGLEQMVASLEDTSRYSSFDLMDAVMLGDVPRTAKIVDAMCEEGVSVFAVLGVLTSQIRRGANTRGMPPSRKRGVEAFFKRLRRPDAVLAECALIDQQGKGQIQGDAWLSLSRLLLRLAGATQVKPPSIELRQGGYLAGHR